MTDTQADMAASRINVFIAFLCTLLVGLEKVRADNIEARLVEHLFSQKKHRLGDTAWKTARPVLDQTDPVSVQFGLSMRQVIEVNEAKQSISIMAYEIVEFIDEYLTWNVSEWGGIKELSVSNISLFWRPRIFCFFLLQSRTVLDPPVLLKHTGAIQYIPQKEFTFPCRLDMGKFPFDSHTCTSKFGSWTQPDDRIKLTIPDEDMGHTGGSFLSPVFIQHPIWDVLEARAKMGFAVEPEHNYTDIDYSISIRRQVSFLAFVLLLPAVMLSLLTMTIFCLPPDTVLKLSLGLSIFLSFFVLLMVLTSASPQQGSIPILGDYFALMMVLIGLSIVCGTITYNLSRKDNSKPLPRVCRSMLRVLGPVLWLHPSHIDPITEEVPLPSIRETLITKECSGSAEESLSEETTPVPDLDLERNGIRKDSAGSMHHAGPCCSCRPNHKRDNIVYSWKKFATLLDRIFFVSYLLINIVAAAVICTWWNAEEDNEK